VLTHLFASPEAGTLISAYVYILRRRHGGIHVLCPFPSEWVKAHRSDRQQPTVCQKSPIQNRRRKRRRRQSPI